MPAERPVFYLYISLVYDFSYNKHMCCRFSISVDEKTIKFRYGLVFVDKNYHPTYNASPGQSLPVITQKEPDQLKLFKWGLVPKWKEDDRNGFVNARAETIDQKPSFSESFHSNRIIIPADGFYEWDKNDKKHIPHRFELEKRELFSFAGIAQIHEKDGKQEHTFSIITTAANDVVGAIHHRMPVILDPDTEKIWLDPASSIEKLKELLKPYGKAMKSSIVSHDLNNPRNDYPNVISFE
jgi:putative SOS response-associated peptidase YedK